MALIEKLFPGSPLHRQGLGLDNVKALIFDEIRRDPDRFLKSIETFPGIRRKHGGAHKY